VQLGGEAWALRWAQQPALLLPFQAPVNAAKVTPSVIQIHAFFHAPVAKAAKVGQRPCPRAAQKYKSAAANAICR
jgi:uncharacterized protein